MGTDAQSLRQCDECQQLGDAIGCIRHYSPPLVFDRAGFPLRRRNSSNERAGMSLRRPMRSDSSSPRSIAYWSVRTDSPLSSAAFLRVYVIGTFLPPAL